MANRFSERAQRAIRISQEEALQWKCDEVSPFHILAALIWLGEGVGNFVLRNKDITVDSIKEFWKRGVCRSPKCAPIGEIPFEPAAKKTLEFAVEAAQGLRHDYVGTEHLLLGLFQIDSVNLFLAEKGLSLAETQDEILSTIGEKEIHSAERGYRDPARFLGNRLLRISLRPEVAGVLLARDPDEANTAAITVLLRGSAQIAQIHKSLENYLPKEVPVYYKLPGRRFMSKKNGKWKETSKSEKNLMF